MCLTTRVSPLPIMNTAVKAALIGAAGASLFLGSYVGFAKVIGADMTRLTVIGNLFSALPAKDAEPSEEPEEQAEPAALSSSALSRELRTPRRAASIIDFFSVKAPFSSEEFKRLSDELLASSDRIELRERQLNQRERELDERSQKLDEDFSTLTRLQTSLDDLASELRQRELELERDVGVRVESEAKVHARIGELFITGDPEELVTRIMMFDAPEAAKILATLEPERANALLAAMQSNERWLEYAEAYAQRPVADESR